MIYCRRCILPDTRPNLEIGPGGVCNACLAHETKRQIDWGARAAAFRAVVANAKAKSTGYDCLVPVSGGKDSTWQVLQVLQAGLRPLAVTWKTPARTPVGQRNLDNLVRLGVDHIDFQINPKIEARFMLEALVRKGDPAIPMHMAIFNIPRTIARLYRIPLIVWGENSAFEYGGTEQERQGFAMDANWLRKYGVTQGTTARDWIGDSLTESDLLPYFGPPAESGEPSTLGVFLGYYFPWDPQTTLTAALQHGFTVRAEGPKVGYYDYADIDDDFISIHHYLKWYKFGFTRLFDNLSLEIRNGRMSRDRAISILKQTGDQYPDADIARFCEFAGISRSRFQQAIEPFRNLKIWEKRGAKWAIPGFLVPDWSW
jgi:N-acetyl sugar amidotransferase